MRSFAHTAIVVAAATILGGYASAGDQKASYHVIFSGSGGEEEYQSRFREWALRLEAALVGPMGVPAEHVVLLREQLGEDAPKVPITAEAIANTLKTINAQLTPQDDLYVYFIGHGAYLRGVSKFNVPGTDVSADDIKVLLDESPAARTIVLDSTSSSAGFINALSGPNRVICTATKSVDEFNATEFMEHFLAGLEDGSADRNHDERISFLEAAQHASELTAAWYMGEGYISTEHALIDDNGDGLGSRLRALDDVPEEFAKGKADTVFDGTLADRCFIKDFDFGPDVPQQMIDGYLAALDQVTALKADKASMEEGPYYAELERRLLVAAKINREIRRIGGRLKGYL